MFRLREVFLTVIVFVLVAGSAILKGFRPGNHLPVWAGVALAILAAATIFVWSATRQRQGLDRAIKTHHADAGIRAVHFKNGKETGPGFLLVAGSEIVWCPGSPASPAHPAAYWEPSSLLTVQHVRTKIGVRTLPGIRVNCAATGKVDDFAVLRGTVPNFLTAAADKGFNVPDEL